MLLSSRTRYFSFDDLFYRMPHTSRTVGTAAHNFTGAFTVTFNTPFSAPPAVTASSDDGPSLTPTVVDIEGATASQVTFVVWFSNGDSPLDEPVHFIVIGPR